MVILYSRSLSLFVIVSLVLLCCTFGMVIDCGRGCDSGTVIPLLLKDVVPPATDLIQLCMEYRLEGLDLEIDLQLSIVIVVP